MVNIHDEYFLHCMGGAPTRHQVFNQWSGIHDDRLANHTSEHLIGGIRDAGATSRGFSFES
jgi:hypothetical protein